MNKFKEIQRLTNEVIQELRSIVNEGYNNKVEDKPTLLACPHFHMNTFHVSMFLNNTTGTNLKSDVANIVGGKEMATITFMNLREDLVDQILLGEVATKISLLEHFRE